MEQILINKYNIIPTQITRINQGIMSKVYQVVTNDKSYILRDISKPEELFNHLEINQVDQCNITPKLIQTVDNQKYYQDKTHYILVQEYIEGHQIKVGDLNNLKTIGETVSRFSQQLQKGNFKIIPDKFDLKIMYDTLKDNESILIPVLNDFGFNESFIQQIIEKNQDNQNIIHADLGIWNMIQQDNQVRIIDFGEIRKGSVVFDYASAFMYLINMNFLSIEEIMKYAEEYLSSLNNQQIKLEVFYDYCLLWLLRGVVANQLYNPSLTIADTIKTILNKAISISKL